MKVCFPPVLEESFPGFQSLWYTLVQKLERPTTCIVYKVEKFAMFMKQNVWTDIDKKWLFWSV